MPISRPSSKRASSRAISRSCGSIERNCAPHRRPGHARGRERSPAATRDRCDHFRRLRQRFSQLPNSSNRFATVASGAGKIVSADPNPRHPIVWKNVTAVKPNRSEAFLAAGVPWSDPVEPAEDDQALLGTGRSLLEKWDTQYLLITLGEQGMMLFERGRRLAHSHQSAAGLRCLGRG